MVVYQPVVERIRRAIGAEDLAPGARVTSELALVRETGLSRVSVRRAVQRLIDEGLVERRPGKGVFVRELHTATRVVEVLVPNLAIHRCVQIVRGAKARGLEAGIRLHVADAHGSIEQDLARLRMLRDGDADGAIVLSLHRPPLAGVLFGLSGRRFPFVVVDEQIRGLEGHCVVSENRAGGYRVGRELLALGHRRIGFIGPLSTHTTRDRRDGLCDALNDAGLPFERDLVRSVDESFDTEHSQADQVDHATRDLMMRPARPTALFYAFDAIAAVGCRALKAIGLRIPDDVSVVGFDDDPLCELVEPPLTTVRQESQRLGRLAMTLLLDQMVRHAVPAADTVVPTSWVCRGSTGPAPRRSTGTDAGRGPATERHADTGGRKAPAPGTDGRGRKSILRGGKPGPQRV